MCSVVCTAVLYLARERLPKGNLITTQVQHCEPQYRDPVQRTHGVIKATNTFLRSDIYLSRGDSVRTTNTTLLLKTPSLGS